MIRLEKKNGSKTTVWIGEITPDGIEIKHGVETRTLRTINIPIASCDEGLEERLEKLVVQQVRNGFVVIGNAPVAVKAVYAAQRAVADQTIKEALSESEPTSYSTW